MWQETNSSWFQSTMPVLAIWFLLAIECYLVLWFFDFSRKNLNFGHNVIIAYSHAFNLTCSRMRMHIFTAILVLLFLLLFGTVGENSGCPSLPLIYFSCSISFLIFVLTKYGGQTESYFQPYQKWRLCDCCVKIIDKYRMKWNHSHVYILSNAYCLRIKSYS